MKKKRYPPHPCPWFLYVDPSSSTMHFRGNDMLCVFGAMREKKTGSKGGRKEGSPDHTFRNADISSLRSARAVTQASRAIIAKGSFVFGQQDWIGLRRARQVFFYVVDCRGEGWWLPREARFGGWARGCEPHLRHLRAFSRTVGLAWAVCLVYDRFDFLCFFLFYSILSVFSWLRIT